MTNYVHVGSDPGTAFAVEIFNSEGKFLVSGIATEHGRIFASDDHHAWIRVHFLDGSSSMFPIESTNFHVSMLLEDGAALSQSFGEARSKFRPRYSRKKKMRRYSGTAAELLDGVTAHLFASSGSTFLAYVDDAKTQASFLVEYEDHVKLFLAINRDNVRTEIHLPGSVRSVAVTLGEIDPFTGRRRIAVSVMTRSPIADAAMSYLSSGNLIAAKCCTEWAIEATCTPGNAWESAAAGVLLASIDSPAFERILPLPTVFYDVIPDWTVLRELAGEASSKISHQDVEMESIPAYLCATRLWLRLLAQAEDLDGLRAVRARLKYLMPRTPFTAVVGAVAGGIIPGGGLRDIDVGVEQRLPSYGDVAISGMRWKGI